MVTRNAFDQTHAAKFGGSEYFTYTTRRKMPIMIYLAGPDVFLPNAIEVGKKKMAICEEFGFEGSPVQVTMRLREKRAGKSRPGGRSGTAAGRRS